MPEIKESEITEFLVQSNYIENERSQQAHDDARVAWDYLVQKDELTEATLLETHYWLLRNLDREIAGKIRAVNVMILSKKERLPHWQNVPQMLTSLIRVTEPEADDIQRWHVAFERIHPFRDGNGRTGRIIMNWQRIKQGLPLLIIHEGMEQQEYYKWFE